MPVYLKILTLVFGLAFFLIFINLVKNKSIKPFLYNVVVDCICFYAIHCFFEGFYKAIATSIGLTDASFLIIVALISFLLIYVLYLSIKISEMSDRIQELISYTSILENKIRKQKTMKIVDFILVLLQHFV